MTTKWTKRVLTLAVSLGMGLYASATVSAQEVVHGHGNRGSYVVPQPYCPAPAATHPTDLPPDGVKPPEQQPEQAQAPQVDMGVDSPSSSTAGAGASAPGMQGRGDFNNRFNLFDNMAAIPQSRIWIGYQYQEGFNTGFNTASGLTELDHNRNVNLYRFGVEAALNNRFSFAFQAQYVASSQSIDNADAWANPQFLVKWAAVNDCDTVITPTLGFQPQTSTSDNELHDRSSRFYPGVLFFQGMGDDLFLQGGAQMGIATTVGSQTFDMALSAGYWLYRDSAFDVAGRQINERCRGGIVGVIPQVEILSKNVFARGSSVPVDLDSGNLAIVDATGGFREGRNVYDITLGGRVIFSPNVSMGIAYSLPISGAEVRQNEFMTSMNFSF